MTDVRADAYVQMVAANTLDVAVLLVRRDWRPRPTPVAHAVVQSRHQPDPTWLRRQLAGV